MDPTFISLDLVVMDTSVQSALAIVVPSDLSTWIQEVRSEHDSAFKRWPPHIKYVFRSPWPFLIFSSVPPSRLTICHFTFKTLMRSLLYSLLFPFIPEKDFKAQLPRLESALAALPNFHIKLHNTSYFKHGSRRYVLILTPEESVRHILHF